jgi:hypothetical protein
VSAYPAGTVAQVRALQRYLKRHRNLDKAAVLLMVDGYEVSARALQRATKTLVLDRFEDELDPESERRFRPPGDVAAQASDRILKRRLRTDQERNFRADDLQRAGGQDELKRLLRGVIMPLFGGLDPAVLGEALDKFGLRELAEKLASASPEFTDTLRREAQAGALSIDTIRNLLPKMSSDDFGVLVRASRIMLALAEAHGIQPTPSDLFQADFLQALRFPALRSKPNPDIAGSDAEHLALRFFAKQARKRGDEPKAA